MSRVLRSYCVVVVYMMIGLSGVSAQTEKVPLSVKDVRLWRSHSVELSDNGQWYTTHYNLTDESKNKKDTIFQKLVEKTSEKFYIDNNKTNTLYIHNAREGLKYEIPDANTPKFSSNSEWIAYKIVPKSKTEATKREEKKDSIFIGLKHLTSGFSLQYESKASYSFLEGKNYFITNDKNSLLVYDLDNRSEHFIGNIGEYLVNKESNYIAYTIASEDKRGNGVYLYSLKDKTTKALMTGSFNFSNLSWNTNKSALACYKYKNKEKETDYSTVSIVVLSNITSNKVESSEYPIKEMDGIPEDMGFAVNLNNVSNKILWSNDEERLFVKLKKLEKKTDNKKAKESEDIIEADVQIWHWKDEKLLSERIMSYEKEKNKVFDAIFFRASKKIVPLTGEDIQSINFSKGTDQWAIGTDNRKYISDWDVTRNDLYCINLNTGQKKLFKENHSSSYYSSGYFIAPDGESLVYWDGKDYWYYDFEKDSKQNISDELNVSFINKDYDKFGYSAQYGFVGWTKDKKSVIVNHKLDLWQLPLNNTKKAKNLTNSVTSKDSIRFRFAKTDFQYETDIKDRYIDLSKPTLLYVFNTQNKYNGYYKLKNNKLTELIYEPASFSSSRRRNELITSKNSDVIIYKEGDYQNYPEAYLSDLSFSKPKQITNTNPQQEQFKWGKRILIDYTNDDGVPLQGILSIPEGFTKGQKLPMMVYSYEKHAYAMYRYANPYLSGTSIPEMLYISNGYLFLQPDIHFNVGTPHSDMHECIDAAIEKVIELGYVDEEKIGYQGYSFGGHTGMYVSTQDNKFVAIAAGGGVSNLVQGFNLDIVRDGSNEQDYYMTGQGRLGTDPTSDTDMYISESPVFNAQNMNTPLLLFAGTEDKVVQWEHSFGFYSILRYLKKPVVLLSYRGEGHGLRNKESTRLDIQKRLKEFFDHYLKDDEPKKWMIEETPYVPEEKSKDETDKKTTPKWK